MSDENETGTELVRVTMDAQALALLLSGLGEAPEPSKEESQAANLAILTEMLNAETEEELWQEPTIWSSKDEIDEVFEILDVRAYRSKYERDDGSKGGFLSCRAVHVDTGELGILNTSAMRLCAKIGWYYLKGRLPVTLRVVKIGESARGYDVLDGRLVTGNLAETTAPATAA